MAKELTNMPEKVKNLTFRIERLLSTSLALTASAKPVSTISAVSPRAPIFAV
jgi:hypothetical protein